MAFIDVVTGGPTLASNLNQLVDALNGNVASAISLLATSATTANNPLNAILPTSPASDCSVVESFVSGDSVARVAEYIRGSDGYGGLWGGHGTSVTAHLYAQSGGWKIDENLTIGGALTVVGSTSVAGLTTSGAAALASASVSGTLSVVGTSTLDNGNITTDGTGNISSQQGISLYNGKGVTAIGSFFYINAVSVNGTRFQTGGNTIAHFGKNTDTFQLIVNGGFQYGSGGADDAELEWTDEPAQMGPASVVCWVEDERHGGKLVACTHEDCPGAGIISTHPASAKGGAIIQVEETLPGPDGTPVTTLEPQYDPSPNWQPLALEGRVPARTHTDKADWRRLPGGGINWPVVSDGRAGVRPWQRGDQWPIGRVTSLQSDVDGTPLSDTQVLVLLH